jgi:hypothetical protein
MQHLGYKRFPKDWLSLSLKAEERIGRFLAVQARLTCED